MRWMTHQTGAIVLAFALQMPVEGIAATSAGAILPDVIDQKLSSLGPTKKSRQRIFNNIHRGSSHWFGWWLALFLTTLIWPEQPFARNMAAGLAFGALSHVLLDLLTTKGVPLAPFSRKNMFSLKLCKTGQASEYVFLAVLVVIGMLFFGEELSPWLEKTAYFLRNGLASL